MKHKSASFISLTLAAAFLWQNIAWARPPAPPGCPFGERPLKIKTLRPAALKDRQEEFPEVLRDFKKMEAKLLHRIVLFAARIKAAAENEGSALHKALKKIVIEAAPPVSGQPKAVNALSVVLDSLQVIGKLREGVWSEEQAVYLGEAIINVDIIIGNLHGKNADIDIICGDAGELFVLSRVYIALLSVLRNSRCFASGDFEADAARFIKDTEQDLWDRFHFAEAGLFVRGSIDGLIIFYSENVINNSDKEHKVALTEATRSCVSDCVALNHITGAQVLTFAGNELCGRFAAAKDRDEEICLAELLDLFIAEGAPALTSVTPDLKQKMLDKIIDMRMSGGLPFIGLDRLSLDLAYDLVSDIHKRCGIEGLLRIVESEEPPCLVYHAVNRLYGMLRYRELDKYDPELARRIKDAIRKRVASSHWGALGPEEMEMHLRGPFQRQLNYRLRQGVEEYALAKSSIDVFNAYFPGNTDRVLIGRSRASFERVNAEMSEIPRDLFLPTLAQCWACVDSPLGIPGGHGQTISQPTMVQRITALVKPEDTDKVLEIGTGSGYQAAGLSRLTRHVHTIDVYRDLAQGARDVCDNLGMKNITFWLGDGSAGLAQEGPFDIIIVSAGAPYVPEALLEQLNPDGGRLLIPVQGADQSVYYLTLIIRESEKEYEKVEIETSQWVPLVGAHGHKNAPLDKEAYLGPPVRLSAGEGPVCGDVPQGDTLDAEQCVLRPRAYGESIPPASPGVSLRGTSPKLLVP